MLPPAWILLLISLVCFLCAGGILTRDAREGYSVTMGAAGLSSGTWLVGSVTGAAGLSSLFGISWGWAIPIFVVLYGLKSPATRVIEGLFLGVDAPPLPESGFKEHLRRTDRDDRS